MRAAFYFIYNQLEKQRPELVEIILYKKNQSITELVLILLLNYFFEIFKSQNPIV
jgi:hypothetical protein